MLVVALIFSWKQSRDDQVAEESIQAMQSKADAYAEKLTGEYGLPLADLLDRVLELGSFLRFWIRKSAEIAVIVHKHSRARGQRIGRDKDILIAPVATGGDVLTDATIDGAVPASPAQPIG